MAGMNCTVAGGRYSIQFVAVKRSVSHDYTEVTPKPKTREHFSSVIYTGWLRTDFPSWNDHPLLDSRTQINHQPGQIAATAAPAPEVHRERSSKIGKRSTAPTSGSFCCSSTARNLAVSCEVKHKCCRSLSPTSTYNDDTVQSLLGLKTTLRARLYQTCTHQNPLKASIKAPKAVLFCEIAKNIWSCSTELQLPKALELVYQIPREKCQGSERNHIFLSTPS